MLTLSMTERQAKAVLWVLDLGFLLSGPMKDEDARRHVAEAQVVEANIERILGC